MSWKRHPKKIELGKDYLVWFHPKRKFRCRFIQPTKCGYNFLNLNTHKCILRRHLYPSKCENHSSGNWFWCHELINIEKI